MSTHNDSRIAVLLLNLDRAFEKSSFHGTTLRGSLRGLDAETAAWKPASDRNSIWQLLLHAAYWKYIVRRHLTGDTDTKFPRSPSNFPAPPTEAIAKSLKRDVRLVVEQHQQLRAAVVDLDPARLEKRLRAKGPRPLDLILGVAAHDLYHAGQIQLLKRLRGK